MRGAMTGQLIPGQKKAWLFTQTITGCLSRGVFLVNPGGKPQLQVYSHKDVEPAQYQDHSGPHQLEQIGGEYPAGEEPQCG